MSLKIAHFADIHLLNSIEKLKEQKTQFSKIYETLEKEKPDLIFIVGDFLDKFLMNNEAKSTASEFLREISKHTQKVILTLGNHETNQKNSARISSVESLIKIINSEKILFFNKTDFFTLDGFNDIVLTNWNYGEYINPYIDLKEKYVDLVKNDPFFIDLYHNPINGSKNNFGKEFKDKHYLSIDDFKGNLLMLGDIHQRQFFYKENELFGGYPSSLFQLNFGESTNKHGFLIWDIDTDNKTFTVKEIDIQSDYVYANIYINNGFDYDDIHIELGKELESVKNIRIKINWFEYSANMTRPNERALKSYILTKYSQVKEIRVEKIYLDKNDNAKANESTLLRINQKSVQREILLDYLKNVIKCTDEDLIAEIMLVEDDIDSRLSRSATGDDLYTWEIESFYVDNFRSHGDRWDLYWKDLNGLWKIDGLNQQGKTNLWSSICYILYGEIIESERKLKFGDNRFINNKRNLDYCECGCIIIINEERYSVTRRTERKWNKYHTELTACPTTLSIKKIDSDNNVLEYKDEEEKNKTIKMFEECVGTFDDFLRSSVITSDTLNSLLKMNESEFMDSILKDGGLDIYEKKAEIHKSIKKQTFKKEERIIIDVSKAESDILSFDSKINEFTDEIKVLDVELLDKNERIKKGSDLKDNELKKLHNIEAKYKNMDVKTIHTQVNDFINKKQQKIEEIELLENKISVLPDSYDEKKLEGLKEEKNSLSTEIIRLNQSIKSIDLNIEGENHKISVINGDIYLSERQIKNIDQQINNEQQFITKQIDLKKSEIDILENSKVCPSCKQNLKAGSSALEAILEKIENLKKDIDLLINETTESEKIKTLNDEKESLTTLIIEKKSLIIPHETTINNHKKSIPLIEKDINRIRLIVSSLDMEIKGFDIIIKDIEQRNRLIAEKNNIPLQIENIDHKIKECRVTIELYDINQQRIAENAKIEEKINIFQNRLDILSSEKQDVQNKINKLKNVEINNLQLKISDISDKIAKFKEQERKEMVYKYYQDSLSRDGIPRLLLLKMRTRLNDELAYILQDMNFSVYFNEDLWLKLYDNIKPEAEINVIESCGKERTFGTFALKMALRLINNRSINNMLLLDEVTAKLMDNSVTEFFALLDMIKSRIDKILIIEHAYGEDLLVDYRLEVVKNIEGISSINIS